MAGEALQIRLLGELEVSLRGQRLQLPPSKKTRALLAYLALSGRAHRRERLCELLWDVADDPRAALRWSLSKLRELVDEGGKKRLHADRERVALDTSELFIDARELKRLVGPSPESVPSGQLEQALALFRGELLEGLELPDFHGYHAFCVAERKLMHELHKAVLHALLARAGTQPGRALALARDLVQLDPLDELARAKLHELLHASGRHREAEEEARVTKRLLTHELPQQASRPSATGDAEAHRASLTRASSLPSPTIGRASEFARLTALLAADPPALRVILIEGEAGIGKSHLLRATLMRALQQGASVVETCAQELHPGWPFAPWIELLQSPSLALDAEARDTLGPLWSSEVRQVEGQRERLFQTVTRVLADSAKTNPPLVLAFDDVHWLDEGSTALLQYVIHACRGLPLRIVLSARAGELADHSAAQRLLREVRRKGQLESLALGPLGRDETRELVLRAGSQADPELIYARSGGHPLFALELSRTSGSTVPESITQAVRDRVAGLSPEAADVLRWAALLGTTFELPLLEGALQDESSVAALEQLERHGFLQLDSEQQASFAHDIVRHAIYDGLSLPRRRLMHQRVAHLLVERFGASGARAPELAHHAALAGDAALAARAYLDASRRCIRLFAEGDALTLARRGLTYAEMLQDPLRTTLSIELVETGVMAGKPSQVTELLALLGHLCERALDLREVEHARRGFYVRAFAMWERGNTADAQRFSREAERISRLGDERARVCGLCDAARCLVSLERELATAEAFVLEAEALATRLGIEPWMLTLARGILCLHRGEYARARRQLEKARDQARHDADRLSEFYALSFYVECLLSERRFDVAVAPSYELAGLGERLREGSDGPYARALGALARYSADPKAAPDGLDDALRALAMADAQQRSAYVLARAAEAALGRGDHPRADAYARSASASAHEIERPSEAVVAAAVLARLAAQEARAIEAHEHAKTLRAALSHPISAYARAAAEQTLAALEELVPSSKGRRTYEARHRRKSLP